MAAAQNAAEEIAAVEAAAEKYRDVNVALTEGFVPDPSDHCISAAEEGLPPEWGGMGIHYLNMAALKITAGEPRVDGEGTHTDFMNPALLLYEPQKDGSLDLVGVENLVFQQVIASHRHSPAGFGMPWQTIQQRVPTRHMGSSRITTSMSGFAITPLARCCPSIQT